jgi:hypothetical protein
VHRWQVREQLVQLWELHWQQLVLAPEPVLLGQQALVLQPQLPEVKIFSH